MTEQSSLGPDHVPIKLRVEDFLLLDESGAFDGYAKTQLIEGELFFTNPRHRPHARIKTHLLMLLAEALKRMGGGLETLVEVSVAMPPINVPLPDIVVTDDARGEGPMPLESARLIVEVADASLGTDLNRKAAIYARHRIAEYWVVDVRGREIHQFWSPREERYSERRVIAFGEPIASATIAGLTVETDGLE
jgi:Uma2 family endonuclease